MSAGNGTLRRGARLMLCVGAAAAALGVAACGGDDESGSASGGGGGGSSSAPASTGAAKATQDTPSKAIDFKEYEGGKSGKASGTPFKVGWINNQGGQSDFPEATRAAQATAKYINTELGGIDGHPLQLETCFVASAEEEGQKCGQRFANDSDMKVVVMGALVIGNESYHAQIRGSKVTLIGVSNSPADYNAKNVFALFGSSTSVLGPFGTYLRDVLHAKSAAMVFNQQAGTIPIANAMRKGVEDAGVKVKVVGFDPQTTDLLGPITAAGSQTADVLMPVTDVPACINYAKSLKSSGLQKPVVAAPLCLAAPVSEALGDIPKWTYGIAQDLPTDLTNPTVKAYNDVLTKYGSSQKDASNVFSGVSFSVLMALAKIVNDTGADASVDDIAKAVHDFKGPMIMGPPSLQCGKDPKATAVCSDQTQFYDYKGKGKFVKVANWLRPPTAG